MPSIHPPTERFEVSNPAIRKSKEWIPDIAPVIQGKSSLLKLIREYHTDNPGIPEEELERVFQNLTGIVQRQVGLIELDAHLDIQTVTEIFIRINSKGVVLSQADFAMSKIAANESHGGNQLRKAIDYFCHLAVAPQFFSTIQKNDAAFSTTDYFKQMSWLKDENDDLYDPSYSDMLRVAFTLQFSRGRLDELVALLSGRNFETQQYEAEIEEASYKRLKVGVEQFMNKTNFECFVMIVKSAGFIDPRLVRAQNPLNFAYILYLKLRQEKYNPAEIGSYVRRWFVLSLLTGRYSSSPESQFDQDIRQISSRPFGEYISLIEQAELSDAFWTAGLVQALATSSSTHPTFSTYLAAQVKTGDLGFLSSDIQVQQLLLHHGDIHHVFPRAYLKAQGLKRGDYNQVANYVFMQTEINISIGKKSPAEYLQNILAQCSTKIPKLGGIVDEKLLRANLLANAIPLELLDNPKLTYAKFLAARRTLMAAKIRKYYEGL